MWRKRYYDELRCQNIRTDGINNWSLKKGNLQVKGNTQITRYKMRKKKWKDKNGKKVKAFIYKMTLCKPGQDKQLRLERWKIINKNEKKLKMIMLITMHTWTCGWDKISTPEQRRNRQNPSSELIYSYDGIQPCWRVFVLL